MSEHAEHESKSGQAERSLARRLASVVTLSAVSGAIVASIIAPIERIGDKWAQRGDDAGYDAETRQQATGYADEVAASGLALRVYTDDIGAPHDIPVLSAGSGLHGDFDQVLANASRPGGQPSDQLSADPYRYDLEWNGPVIKKPSKHCVTLDVPNGARSVVAWQTNSQRATIEVGISDEEPVVIVCQHSDTAAHHEVALQAVFAS
jgi:hypothetical protein